MRRTAASSITNPVDVAGVSEAGVSVELVSPVEGSVEGFPAGDSDRSGVAPVEGGSFLR